jgi:hypothetical protein
MGSICYYNECCGNDTLLNSPRNYNEPYNNNKDEKLVNSNSGLLNNDLKNVTISSNIKKQIVVIIAAGKSLQNNQFKINDHIEYEVSKFYVVEQMKITAKELKPNAILQAISNSNRHYSFLHNGFSVFSKGEQSILYKKMRIVDVNSNELLLPGVLYYLFAENYNEILEDNTCSKDAVVCSPKFKKLNFYWKKQKQEQKTKQNYSSSNQNPDSSELSNSSSNQIQKRINISSVNDRKTKYSILNSMHTIKEVDSFNTSAFNITLNTNNIGSAPFSNNNSILNSVNN